MLILENQTEVFACGDSAKPTQKLYRYGYPSTKHEAGIDAFQNDPVKRAAWIKKLLEVWSLRKADPAIQLPLSFGNPSIRLESMRFRTIQLNALNAQWLDMLSIASLEVWKIRKNDPKVYEAFLDQLRTGRLRGNDWRVPHGSYEATSFMWFLI